MSLQAFPPDSSETEFNHFRKLRTIRHSLKSFEITVKQNTMLNAYISYENMFIYIYRYIPQIGNICLLWIPRIKYFFGH